MNKNSMAGINKGRTIDDIILWKNNKNSISVEEYNMEFTKKLGWNRTDVLYSILSIYAIGMYSFYPDRYVKKNYIIKELDTGKKIYTNKFMRENYKACTDLNDFLQESGFIKSYYDIGNVIPIWPGGNIDRGRSYCYDLPELYFNNENVKPWTNHLIELNTNCCFEEILNTAFLYDDKGDHTNKSNIIDFCDTPGFLNSIGGNTDGNTKDDRVNLYSGYIHRIVGIINSRTKRLHEILIE